MTKVKPIPDGYSTITPFLSIKNAAKAIEFYKKAFGAQEIEVHAMPDGKIMHAVIKIGNSLIMLADEFDQGCGVLPPQTLKGTTVMLHLYVNNVDAAFDKAIKAGAKVRMPVEDMFWGDRYGQLEDPFGHMWSVATHTADLSPEEVEEAASQFMEKN